MKITHWAFKNGSGLANVAADISAAERKLGLQSQVIDTLAPETWDAGINADVHVAHSHIPDCLAHDTKVKFVTVQHGTPEHVFDVSVQQGLRPEYAPGDALSVSSFLMRQGACVVTFIDRHAAIWETMTETPVFLIPCGVDKEFWKRIEGIEKLVVGFPSIFVAENCCNIKWPLDLVLMWPWVIKRFPNAKLHICHVPLDQHRWWYPLAYMNGSIYSSYISPISFSHDLLRKYLSTADYYFSPVRYGDINRSCIEAKACGCKLISFKGNPYADFWLDEGDQRKQAEQLCEILGGKTQVREPESIPDIMETAYAMLKVYKFVLTGEVPEEGEESGDYLKGV